MAASTGVRVLGRIASPGGVVAGYVLAILAGWAAAAAHDAYLRSQPYDTSGGMFAAGVMLAGLGVFLVAALVPTLLALWLLRRSAPLWLVVAGGAFVFAVAGLVAVLAPLVAPGSARSLTGVAIELLGLAQLLGAPLWAAAFALFAVIAPTPGARRLLAIAIGIEFVIGALAAIHWLVPSSPI